MGQSPCQKQDPEIGCWRPSNDTGLRVAGAGETGNSAGTLLAIAKVDDALEVRCR
jgi:hypothetical protein